MEQAMNWKRNHRILVVSLLMLAGIEAAGPLTKGGPPRAMDPALASAYFNEASQMSEADAGKLWGVRLYGPMLLVDPSTHSALANGPDTEGLLTKIGDVYSGVLPSDVNVANTATAWAGVKWTMIRWPLPENRRDRLSLMAH